MSQPPVSLPRRVRRRGLIVILINVYLMWSGFFMVVPLLSVYTVNDLGWPAASIGIILGVRQLVQQTLTVGGGALADRFGAKWLIAIGLAIRVIGFGGMAWATDFGALLLMAILSAVGGALFDAPSGAAVAALTTPEERPRYYSLRGVINGLGLTTGPLIGALLVGVDFAWVALMSAACYMVALIITLLFFPSVQVGAEDQSLLHGFQLALRDRAFMVLTALSMGYWFMWVQLTIAMPLQAEALSGSSASIAAMYLVNAITSIALQVPLRALDTRLRSMPALCLGLVVMAAGVGSIAFAPSFPAMLASIAVFSAGNLVALANLNTVIAGMAHPEARGSYFGVSAMGLAIGGSLGNMLGSAMYGASVAAGRPAVPWLVIMVVGLASAAGVALLDRYVLRRTARGLLVTAGPG